MKVLAIVGSPRKGGNTDILVDYVIRGAEEAGAEVEKIYLHELNVAFCEGCSKCADRKNYHGCALKDDMIGVHEALKWCDAFVVGTPIFFFGPSAQTKLFLDRLYALINSDVNGDKHALRGKRMAVAIAYGGTDPFSSGAVNAYGTFRDTASFFKLSLVGVVYGSAVNPGDIAEDEELLAEAAELGRRLCA